MTVYWILHIPRTGGMSRRELFEDREDVICCGHNVRLSDVPHEAQPVVFLRGPIARFRSAYDHLVASWVHDIEGETFLDRWPTLDKLALDLRSAIPILRAQAPSMFRAQVEWLDAARSVWIGRTETMTATESPTTCATRLGRHSAATIRFPFRRCGRSQSTTWSPTT